jgi:hypothetical protein
VKERFTVAGLDPPDFEKARAKVVNECTILVQELFQQVSKNAALRTTLQQKNTAM